MERCGAKVIGTGLGAGVMGTILVPKGLSYNLATSNSHDISAFISITYS